MASGAAGGANHVIGELFKMMIGVNMIHMPYWGEAPALTDPLRGRVQVQLISMSEIGHTLPIRSGDHVRIGPILLQKSASGSLGATIESQRASL
jgi:tripartite-type tricarboxylate transporter receptor subunit TctC